VRYPFGPIYLKTMLFTAQAKKILNQMLFINHVPLTT
jgi:hypothetical protein